MIKIRHILMMLVVMLLASCTNDDLTQEKGQVVKVRVPITLITGQPMAESTRAIGDPGYDDKLPPTEYLYVWAYYKTSENQYAVEYRFFHLNNEDWTDDNNETVNSKYSTNEPGLSLEGVMDGTNVGKVYVLASNRALTNDQLSSLYYTINGYNVGFGKKTGLSSDPISSMTFIIPANNTNVNENWTSNDLRDLYSNPIDDTETDDNTLGNGVIKKEGNVITVGTIRLYHCAAKVDFKWEVAEELRSTTSIASITCTGLPTKLNVFTPTANSADNNNGSCLVVGTGTNPVPANILTPENKYIGRACAYVLQPQSKYITYSVDFTGSRTDITNKQTLVAPNNIYTTWYRVVAEVKDQQQ